MPRIDPITGVPVMTMPEFIAKEAERHGHTYDEELQSFTDEMVEAQREEERHVREHALDLIAAAIADEEHWRADGDKATEMPVAIIDFNSIGVPSLMARIRITEFEAYAVHPDGTVRMFHYRHFSDSGTRLEPPEGEVEVRWGEEQSGS